jgi:hypothetical protein
MVTKLLSLQLYTRNLVNVARHKARRQLCKDENVRPFLQGKQLKWVCRGAINDPSSGYLNFLFTTSTVEVEIGLTICLILEKGNHHVDELVEALVFPIGEEPYELVLII